MLLLGILLLIAGYLLGIGILATLGWVLIVIGILLLVIGMAGHPLGGPFNGRWY